VKVFIVARVIFQRRNPRPTQACRPPRCPWATHKGQAREGRGAGRGGGRGGGRATGRGAGLVLRGPGGARPPRHASTAAAAVFVQLALRWGRNWAAQWHLARAVAKRFRGCRVKHLYVDNILASNATGSPGFGAVVWLAVSGRSTRSGAPTTISMSVATRRSSSALSPRAAMFY